MSLLLDASHRLIDGFCRPDETGYPFINMFGPYTPCFVNTGLGVFHTLAILAIAMHLHRLLASPAYSKYRLTRAFLPWAAVCTAALCVLLPLFELNGKLGEARGGDQPTPAPYEYLDPLLACLTWTSFACMLYTEANGRYVYEGRTLVRVGIILAFSAELAKTRILWAMWDDLVKHDYFFFLHLSYVGMQSILGLMALCWWPEKGDQVLEHEGYMPIPDGSEDLHNNVSPEATAGIWSSFLFTWMTPLISAGYRAPLTKEQIWKLRPHDRVDYVSEKFRRHWAEECAQPGPRGGASLFRACLNTVSHLFVTAIPWKLLCDASQFVGPLFLNLLLKLLSDPDAPVWLGYAYAGVMFAGTLVGVLADNQHFVRTTRAGLRLKAMLSAVVYDKVFSLTPASRANFTSGRIFNLISSDSETLSMLSVNCMAIISSPVRIIVAVYFLWLQLGVAAFVSVVFLLAMIPLNLVLVSWSAFLLKTALGHTDERTKLEGELMGGMEVVKCSSWESPFLARIQAARQKELDVLLKVSLLQAVVLFILFAVPTIVPVATFGAYLYLGHDLSAAEAFTALALFNVLRFPLFVLPQIIQLWTNARVSVTRLQEFLSSEDLEETPPTPAAKPGETAISVQGDFAWEINRPPILTDVNLEVPAGSLVVVVGSTGSGKSSLLASMLGQMQQVYGPSPKLRGKVAFVPQAAFIINATVRDNILFGLPYDAERYQAAVVASCLDSDFLLLPGGDLTELGDRGVNVSGGQRQRLSIARAIYSEADVLLFDDPLSALDSKVGKRVFDQVIRGALADKTVVLATNQLNFVQASDLILFMSQPGGILERGSFNELTAQGGAFVTMMQEVQLEGDEEVAPVSTEESESSLKGVDKGEAEVEGKAAPSSPSPSSPPPEPAAPARQVAKPGPIVAAATTNKVAKLTEQESASEGSVSPAVIRDYINSLGGTWWFVYLLITFIVTEGGRVLTNLWLAVWTGDEAGERSPYFYLCVYAGISVSQCILQLGNAIETARFGLSGAGKLHESMLQSLLKAPMSFFHTTPIGRIINRLTKDTSDIDRGLMGSASMALRNSMQLLSTLVLMGVLAPMGLPPLTIIMVVFAMLFNYYQASVRQLKRLEAVSRSPVFSSLNEAIAGVATIRAFGMTNQLSEQHGRMVDFNCSTNLMSNNLTRWLSVRLESLGATATLMVAVVAVEQRGKASNMGLVLLYAMQVTVLMSITLRVGSITETLFNSVERVSEYTRLPLEEPERDADMEARLLKPPTGWPTEGTVEFKTVTMRYRPGLPLVIRGISFRAESKDKIGVVGRTGAGKSSMIGCLFRLTEVESGIIEIDGLNISKMSLNALRSKLSLIPQVAVLFTGTIRLNLSPFGLHSEAELWAALRRAHLHAVVESWPAGLDAHLQEGGAPLSAGQKQLLALARALLNPSKVLVLDEATANVDVETDSLIQQTLRSAFANRTMITIAHRLHTVIDYTKVLVLDQGMVGEFGTPATLLANDKSIFSSMVDDTGDSTSKFLRSVAGGKVDINQTFEKTAQDALDKLCNPLSEANVKMCLQMQPTAGAEHLPLHTLASELLSRSTAVSKMLVEAASSLTKACEEEEANNAVASYTGQVMSGPSNTMSSAQRQMMQASAMLVQLQTYAELALKQSKAIQGGRQGGNTSEVQLLLPAGGRNRDDGANSPARENLRTKSLIPSYLPSNDSPGISSPARKDETAFLRSLGTRPVSKGDSRRRSMAASSGVPLDTAAQEAAEEAYGNEAQNAMRLATARLHQSLNKRQNMMDD